MARPAALSAAKVRPNRVFHLHLGLMGCVCDGLTHRSRHSSTHGDRNRVGYVHLYLDACDGTVRTTRMSHE